MGKRKEVPSTASTAATDEHAGVPMPDALSTLLSSGSAPKRVTVGDDIHLLVQVYAEDGSVYDQAFLPQKLWKVEIRCGARPNPMYLLKRVMEKYGQEKVNEADVPKTMQQLLQLYQTKYQWVDDKTRDEDQVGWHKGSSCFYVGGDLKNFLMYLDDLVAWRVEHSDEQFDKIVQKPTIKIYTCQGLELCIDKSEDKTQCDFQLLKPESMPQDASVFAIPPPCFPARIVIMTVTATSDQFACVVWSGGTKPFYQAFNDLKIKMSVDDSRRAVTGQSEYYRVQHNVDFTSKVACEAYLSGILGDKCLKGSPTIVRFRGQSYKPDLFLAVLQELKKRPNVDVQV